MNRFFVFLVILPVVLSCDYAMATPRLTQAECNDYPFVPLQHTVTRKQLMREMAELQAVGYHAGAGDNDYPHDLNVAEEKLRIRYRSDCMRSSHPTGSDLSSAN